MRRFFFLVCVVVAFSSNGQPLRDINFNYVYDPEDFTFTMKSARSGGTWKIDFVIQLRDTSRSASNYSLNWEVRKTLAEKSGQPLPNVDSASWQIGKGILWGRVLHSVAAEPEIMVAKVIDRAQRKAWLFYQILEPNYPTTYALTVGGKPVVAGYLPVKSDVAINSAESVAVSYYNDDFPIALPPFSEAQGKVAKGMQVDSSFVAPPNSTVRFTKKGLYLLQKDTTAAEGLAIRAEDDYPKFSRMRNLAGPMVFICTKQEYDRLSTAKADKKTFDRVVLGITNDTERAKRLIRNYFKRVESANQFFTSYKEGWKTDRGMIYIIFGPPDEVYKFQDRELWQYQSEYYKVNFTFLKSPSLFDPDNYVLIRDRKYQQTWYEVIDLWRNARF